MILNMRPDLHLLPNILPNKKATTSKEAEVAALLHDMGRTVQEEEKGHGPAGVPLARQLLDAHTDYSEEVKQRILHRLY